MHLVSALLRVKENGHETGTGVDTLTHDLKMIPKGYL
jgi:hypothetical protein